MYSTCILWLAEFGKGRFDLPYYLTSYIDLVEESGRCIRDDKRGFIAKESVNTLAAIGLDGDLWLDELKGFKSIGYAAVGTVEQLKSYSQQTGRKRTFGLKLAAALE